MIVSRMFVRVAALLLLATSALGVTACKRDKDSDKGTAAKRVEAAVPSELQSEVAIGNPAALLDEALALVRKFMALPLDTNMLVGLVLQRAGLPSGLAGSLDLQRPIWMVGLDGKKLREQTPSLVALPIRSKQALQSALGVQMKSSGADGELSLYVPKVTSPQLSKLKLWVGETYVLIASSRPAFDAAKRYIRERLLNRQVTHDLQAVLLRHDTDGADVKRTLEQLRSAVRQRTGAGSAKLDAAISALLLRYGEVLTTTPRLEVNADLEGTNLTLRARADSAAGSELARSIKRQKTGPPFAMELIPPQTWGVFGGHDFPGDEKHSLLSGFLHQMAEFFPPAQKDRFSQALSTAAAHFGGSLTVALHRAVDGGLGILLLTRLTDRDKARAAVDELTTLAGQWAAQQAKASGTKTKIVQTTVPCGASVGRLFQIPLTERPVPGSASLLPQLLGDTLGVGWVFARNVGVFALGRSVDKQLALSCAQLQDGKRSSFGDSAAFKRALGDADTRSGLVYLSLVDLVRGLEGRSVPGLEPLLEAIKGHKVQRAASVDWGIDGGRRAFTVNLKLPLGNLLLFKPLLGALGPGGAGPPPGL